MSEALSLSEDPQNSEIERRLYVFFNGQNNLVQKYIELHGYHLNIKLINQVKEDWAHLPPLQTSPQTSSSLNSSPNINDSYDTESHQEQGGESPLYEMRLRCPVCKYDRIKSQQLRGKALVIYQDRFMTPLYKAAQGYQNLNYTLYSVAICPKCLMASPDHKDFDTWSNLNQNWKVHQLPLLVIGELQDSISERRTIFEEFENGQDIFKLPRNWKHAINSYRLALERVQIQIRCSHPYSYFKKGSYWLKIALLEKQNGLDDTASLEMAHAAFLETYLRSDFPDGSELEYQVAYTAAALSLRLGKPKDCRNFMSSLEQQAKQFENSGKKTEAGVVQKWVDKAKNMWEDREYEGFWDLPKPPK